MRLCGDGGYGAASVPAGAGQSKQPLGQDTEPDAGARRRGQIPQVSDPLVVPTLTPLTLTPLTLTPNQARRISRRRAWKRGWKRRGFNRNEPLIAYAGPLRSATARSSRSSARSNSPSPTWTYTSWYGETYSRRDSSLICRNTSRAFVWSPARP